MLNRSPLTKVLFFFWLQKRAKAQPKCYYLGKYKRLVMLNK